MVHSNKGGRGVFGFGGPSPSKCFFLLFPLAIAALLHPFCYNLFVTATLLAVNSYLI